MFVGVEIYLVEMYLTTYIVRSLTSFWINFYNISLVVVGILLAFESLALGAVQTWATLVGLTIAWNKVR
jgi:hypothetical protein